ncbi:MAG: recombinase family protein [Pseudonocardiaceae bacterium]
MTLSRTATNGLARRVAIYCRISMDRAGAGLGVERQADECRPLAEALGWTVVDRQYADNDISAYSGKPRPAWLRLLADIEAGLVDAVICWHVDRLTRTPRELEDVIDFADRRGLALATVTGEIDLATPSGRMTARMLGAAARYESEHKAERQRSQIQHAASKGKQMAGGKRCYGYAVDYEVISGDDERVRRRITGVCVDPVEGEIIRECVRRVLAGEGVASIVRDLNDSGVPAASGGPWQRTTLRRVLCSARISGRREHIPTQSYRGATRPLVGEIVSTTSDWPKIIRAEDSDRVRALLTRPDRRTTTGGARTHLLSGILHCGRCGRPMMAGGGPRYCCSANGGKGGCGRTFITSGPTDERVRDLVLTALVSPEMVQRLRHRDEQPDDLHAQIRADEEKLDALSSLYDELGVTGVRLARAPIVARLEVARHRLAQSTQGNALESFIGTVAEMKRRWETSNLSQRRAVITAALEKVVVHPAPVMGRNRFDSARLELVWQA